MKPGPKPEFSNQTSRDNRTLDQSRYDEVTEMMEKMTPKSKDAFVYARMKEKQEVEKKSCKSPLSFASAQGGKPVKVFPGALARKKLLYDNKAQVPKETFESIASATDISNSKAKLVATEFRKSQGKHSIEQGFSEGLSSQPKEIIKKYFKTVHIHCKYFNCNISGF